MIHEITEKDWQAIDEFHEKQDYSTEDDPAFAFLDVEFEHMGYENLRDQDMKKNPARYGFDCPETKGTLMNLKKDIEKELEELEKEKVRTRLLKLPEGIHNTRMSLIVDRIGHLEPRLQDITATLLATRDPSEITQDEKDMEELKRRAKTVPLTSLVPNARPAGGGRYKAPCPIHEEKTPSFVIYPDNHFYCFGCTESGDSISYIRKTKELGFIDAVKYLTGE